MEGVVLEGDGVEEREVTYVGGERAYQALRAQVYCNDSLFVCEAALDAIPAAEVSCFVPRR